ncbi:MAG: cytochrome C oxidase subunit I [Proteobacteria bacterium]|nr:cytochrome C oxidase subunit I [Pseudomonadota bacterium]NOG61561.1 cytochrome C oxidase subunit I [Pseudomonadota bacterium]
MATSEQFRICQTTGLRVYQKTENLIKANAVVAVVFLAIGGLFGLTVALTRWKAVHLLPADWFYLALTAHGLDVLVVWIVFFEVAVLYFASSVILGCRIATPRWAWAGFVLMLVGALITNVAVLMGKSSVMFTSYVPLKAEPSFYLGIILFAVGALIAVFVFFGTLVVAKQEKTYEGSVPLVTYGATVAAVIAVFTLASGAIILVPTFLWSIGYVSHIDTLMYRTIWWGFGHSSQQINVAAHITIWYMIAAVVLGAKPLSEKVSRGAFLLYILFLQLASAHHLLVDPGISSEWKVFNTSYAIYLAVLGSMIHGLTVPGQIEAVQREKGYNNGLFEWLRKCPWGNPAFSGMFISLVLFGFVGGISGVVMGVEQINIIIHNTIYVPGHFHATVVAGTTLAFMAVTYLLIPLIFRREIMFPRMAKLQPYVFGLGVSGISMFMMGAGTLGVPRRHWDISQADAVLPYDFPGVANLLMGLNGMSALIAGLGGAMFVIVTVGSVFFGKKIEDTGAAVAPSTVDEYGSAEHAKVPGTLVLVGIFFVSFILYFFVNWKYLAEVWPLR